MANIFRVWFLLTVAWFGVLAYLVGPQRVVDSWLTAAAPPAVLLAVWLAVQWVFKGAHRP